MAQSRLQHLIEFQEKFKGSWMEKVIEFMITEKFSPAPEKKVADDEKLIGELDLFEKALLSTRKCLSNGLNTYIDSLPKNVDSLSEDQKKLYQEMKKGCDFIDKLLWRTVQDRLEKSGHEIGSIGIRERYQVVQTQPEDPISNLFEMLIGKEGVTVLCNCDECDHYETCDIPEKKERVAKD
ncbi:MAG: hypothetical protein KAS02_01685 [Candidatus Pacebacteria bacterium]|nr:hypothetical protein [Candidatus Paceibacterota bacterium]